MQRSEPCDIPRRLWADRKQATRAEERQAVPQHSIDSEQRGMAVVRGQVQSLKVIQRRRRIDRKAQQTRADSVPEGAGSNH